MMSLEQEMMTMNIHDLDRGDDSGNDSSDEMDKPILSVEEEDQIFESFSDFLFDASSSSSADAIIAQERLRNYMMYSSSPKEALILLIESLSLVSDYEEEEEEGYEETFGEDEESTTSFQRRRILYLEFMAIVLSRLEIRLVSILESAFEAVMKVLSFGKKTSTSSPPPLEEAEEEEEEGKGRRKEKEGEITLGSMATSDRLSSFAPLLSKVVDLLTQVVQRHSQSDPSSPSFSSSSSSSSSYPPSFFASSHSQRRTLLLDYIFTIFSRFYPLLPLHLHSEPSPHLSTYYQHQRPLFPPSHPQHSPTPSSFSSSSQDTLRLLLLDFKRLQRLLFVDLGVGVPQLFWNLDLWQEEEGEGGRREFTQFTLNTNEKGKWSLTGLVSVLHLLLCTSSTSLIPPLPLPLSPSFPLKLLASPVSELLKMVSSSTETDPSSPIPPSPSLPSSRNLRLFEIAHKAAELTFALSVHVPKHSISTLGRQKRTLVDSEEQERKEGEDEEDTLECHLFISYVEFLIRCPDSKVRSRVFGELNHLLDRFQSSTRLKLLELLLMKCPYPTAIGSLIHSLKNQFHQAWLASVSSSSSSPSSSSSLAPPTSSGTSFVLSPSPSSGEENNPFVSKTLNILFTFLEGSRERMQSQQSEVIVPVLNTIRFVLLVDKQRNLTKAWELENKRSFAQRLKTIGSWLQEDIDTHKNNAADTNKLKETQETMKKHGFPVLSLEACREAESSTAAASNLTLSLLERLLEIIEENE